MALFSWGRKKNSVEQALSRELNRTIKYLKHPLTSSEQRAGWRSDTKKLALNYMIALKRDSEARWFSEPLITARALDDWGVSGGDLQAAIFSVGEKVREFRRENGYT